MKVENLFEEFTRSLVNTANRKFVAGECHKSSIWLYDKLPTEAQKYAHFVSGSLAVKESNITKEYKNKAKKKPYAVQSHIVLVVIPKRRKAIWMDGTIQHYIKKASGLYFGKHPYLYNAREIPKKVYGR